MYIDFKMGIDFIFLLDYIVRFVNRVCIFFGLLNNFVES